MLTNQGSLVLCQIEQKEKIEKSYIVPCAGCGMEPAISGGLGADCLFDKQNYTD